MRWQDPSDKRQGGCTGGGCTLQNIAQHEKWDAGIESCSDVRGVCVCSYVRTLGHGGNVEQ